MAGRAIATQNVSHQSCRLLITEAHRNAYFSAPEKKFEALTSRREMIAWIWAIVIAFSAPEIAVFLRSARLCFFKSFRSFRAHEFGLVCLVEFSYVIGVCLLAFKVLPVVDVVQGAMLTNCFCLVPGILGRIVFVCSLFFFLSRKLLGRVVCPN